MPALALAPDRALPTRWQAVLFTLKTSVFRVRRVLKGKNSPRFQRRHVTHDSGDRVVLAESRTPLFSSEVAAEFALQAGKAQNLRVAAACLDELQIGKYQVFSFWRHIGRPTRRRGFVNGRELREGCIVPSIGGGLCQLSNALYAVALDAGCESSNATRIRAGCRVRWPRRGATRRFSGITSTCSSGRRSTVAWRSG